MTQPTRTPNPATTSRPDRSSKRVARKKPLAWLPLALLALLLLLALLIFLVVRNANDSDKAAGTAGSPTAAPTTAPSTLGSAGPSAATPGSAGAGTSGSGTSGSGSAGTGAVGAGTPISSSAALVGGAGIAAAPAASAGTASGTTVTAPAAGTVGTVLFAEGSAQIDPEGQKVLAAAAQALRSGGATSVQAVGYTDMVAGTPVNGPLSQQRADAVATALRSLLPGVPVTASSKAEADPVATNDTDAGRQQNRRVVLLGTS